MSLIGTLLLGSSLSLRSAARCSASLSVLSGLTVDDWMSALNRVVAGSCLSSRCMVVLVRLWVGSRAGGWVCVRVRLCGERLVNWLIRPTGESRIPSRLKNMHVDDFARLVEAEFDSTDLLFYKYVKTSSKRQVTSLLPQAKKKQPRPPSGSSQPLRLTLEQCTQFSESLFRKGQKHFHLALQEAMASEISAIGGTNEDEVLVDLDYLVYLAVWVFHHHRPDNANQPQRQIKENISPSAVPSPPRIQVSGDDDQGMVDEYVKSL